MIMKGDTILPDKEDDFTAKLMDDMPEDLLDFVKTKVNSFIKWDLVRFFHENPHTADTIENIAKYAGRNVTAVEPELEELVESGIMKKSLLGENSIYSFEADESTQAAPGICDAPSPLLRGRAFRRCSPPGNAPAPGGKRTRR